MVLTWATLVYFLKQTYYTVSRSVFSMRYCSSSPAPLPTAAPTPASIVAFPFSEMWMLARYGMYYGTCTYQRTCGRAARLLSILNFSMKPDFNWTQMRRKRFRGLGLFFYILIPPHTLSTWPVMYLLISDARKSAASAMSSVLPNLPNGIFSNHFSAPPSFR